MADQRQKIIASVFSRRNASGNLEEAYVSHVKIWEDAGVEGGGKKPRYILLSRMSLVFFVEMVGINLGAEANNGSGFIHKSKLNTNGSFSVGKTWTLSELRAVEVVNVCGFEFYWHIFITSGFAFKQPLAFNITLSRTYRWQTENQDDQASFLEALIRLFRVITSGAPLQLDGIEVAAPVTGLPMYHGTVSKLTPFSKRTIIKLPQFRLKLDQAARHDFGRKLPFRTVMNHFKSSHQQDHHNALERHQVRTLP